MLERRAECTGPRGLDQGGVGGRRVAGAGREQRRAKPGHEQEPKQASRRSDHTPRVLVDLGETRADGQSPRLSQDGGWRRGPEITMEVEINLRIPAVKDPIKSSDGWPINNADIRFVKRIEVPKLPKPGDLIELTARPDVLFQGSVTRSDWHDEKEMFVVACRYALPSIPRPQYLSLMADSEWTRRPLLA